jgi:predicted nucleic acid-binding protein
MILIDTSLLIDYLKGPDTILDGIIEKEEVAICGIVLAELFHGINSNREKELIHDAVKDFEWVQIEDTIWHTVGINLNKLKKNGLTVPFQDAVIATLCIDKNIKIATRDKHFERIATILTDLQVYK